MTVIGDPEPPGKCSERMCWPSAAGDSPISVSDCLRPEACSCGAKAAAIAYLESLRLELRGTGVGTAVAVGRLGSIAGPLLAGALVTAGFTPSDVMMALVPITLAAGLTTVLLLMRRRAAPVPA